VITSATSSASGGTTILKMADLSKVRLRAMVNETDIGNVLPGQLATVTVDAFPNRRFQGVVEKVEPQAVVQQSVTMFPVLVSLSNLDGALKPGMNGEVVMEVLRKDNVLAIPSEAVRSMREASTVAPVLGLEADAIRTATQAAFAGRRTDGGGQASAGAPGDSAARAARRAARFASGDSAGAASSTRRRFGGGAGGGAGAGSPAGGAGAGAGGAAAGGRGGRGQMQIAFVKKGDDYAPRPIRTGISDFEYTEVVNGLNLGEQVALVGVAVLQAQREATQARIRAGQGGGLQQTTPPAGGGGPGGGGGGGGGGRPGGR
jgi:HlyD family secretion protein